MRSVDADLLPVPSWAFVNRFARAVLIAAFVIFISRAIGQVPANVQVNPQLAPADTAAHNYRPNDYSVGESIYYRRPPYQTMLLPSEALIAAQRSGAMPSELLIQAQRAGPLNPDGTIAYIPGQTTLQQLMRLPPPQLYNPAYHLSPPLAQASAAGSPAGSIAYGTVQRAALNYRLPPPAPPSVTPRPTRTYSRPGPAPEGSASDSPPATAPSETALPQPPPPTDLGYGSIYFSSISPPSLAR